MQINDLRDYLDILEEYHEVQTHQGRGRLEP